MDEINLIDCWNIIRKHRFFVIGMVVIFTLLIGIYSLFLKPMYRARAVILPVGNARSFSLPPGLGGMVSSLGSLGVNKPGGQFLALLKSETLAEELVRKNPEILKFFHEGISTEDAGSTIKSMSKFLEDPDLNTITIQVDSKDPKLSATVANAYTTALADKINTNTYTSSKRNRMFVEKQLQSSKIALLESGKMLSSFYGHEDISNTNSKVNVSIQGKNWIGLNLAPDDLLLAQQDQMAELEKKKQDLNQKLDAIKIIQNVPEQVYLQSLTLQHQLLEQITALISQQYEMAKIEEAREELSFQVIDSARPPKNPFKPRRSQILLVTFIMSLFGSVFIVFIREYLRNLKPSSAI